MNKFVFYCVLLICFSKHACIISLKDKKSITITDTFLKILDESGHQPNKIWVDKVSKFYNKTMKLQLPDNDIEVHSTVNEGKSVVAERFIRTLKNNFYKYTSISRNLYIDELEDNNITIHHRTIKMNPVDVKLKTLVLRKKIINILNLNFVVMWEYQNIKIFAKGYIPNWSEKVFVIKKAKNTLSGIYLIEDVNEEELIGTFYEK